MHLEFHGSSFLSGGCVIIAGDSFAQGRWIFATINLVIAAALLFTRKE